MVKSCEVVEFSWGTYQCEIFFFFDGKSGGIIERTKVYITLVITPGVHSLVSPKAARSPIYDTSTKVGQCS